MRTRLAAAALGACAILVGAGALAADPTALDPAGFVRDLYANYRDEDFNLFKDPPKVFASDLLAAMDENDRCTPEGEVGAMDFDPLCQCQDFAGMTFEVGKVRPVRAGKASADIKVAWDKRIVPLRLELVLERGAWKVADVKARGERGLLAYLRAENRKACTIAR